MGKRRFGHIGTKVKDISQTNAANSGVFDINEVAILVAEDKWRKFNTQDIEYLVISGGGGSWNGGGAGGYYKTNTVALQSGETFTVTVGNGGSAKNQGGTSKIEDSGGSVISDSEYAWSCHLMRSNSGFSLQRSANTTLINMVGFSGSGGTNDDRYDTGTGFFVYKPFESDYMTMVTAEFGGSYNTPEHWGGQTIGVHKQQEQVRKNL